MSTPTEQLTAEGVSIWLDDLSRSRITSGNLAELIATRNVTGVTDVVGMETFGASGPQKALYEHFGFTPANVAARAQKLIK